MSVIRTLHDRKNPYVMLNKKTLWEPTLSLAAKGLWAQCISRPDNWTFHVTEIAKKNGVGRKTIDKLIKELSKLKLIYLHKESLRSGGRFSGNIQEYWIFETPYTEEVIEEFKKCFRDCHYREVGDGDFGNGNLQNGPLLNKEEETNSSSLRSEEEKKTVLAPTSSSPSADAESLTDFFLSKIREEEPNFKEPNRKKWSTCFDRMIRLDKRSVQEIEDMICWVRQDLNSKPYNLSPESLRKNFDNNTAFMKKDAIKDRIRYNLNWSKSAKQKYPENLKSMSFSSKFVNNTASGMEVLLDLPHESFVAAFKSIFGGR